MGISKHIHSVFFQGSGTQVNAIIFWQRSVRKLPTRSVVMHLLTSLRLAAPCSWEILPAAFTSLHEFTHAICGSGILDKAVALSDRCRQLHRHQSLINTPLLPSRVIDVGHSDDEIKLVPGHGVQHHYICLSHCWAGKQPLVTSKQNITDHLSAIHWDNIPKLYQDAICVTRKLGQRYMWIDSLTANVEKWRQRAKADCSTIR